jgi:hypothetical protein
MVHECVTANRESTIKLFGQSFHLKMGSSINALRFYLAGEGNKEKCFLIVSL